MSEISENCETKPDPIYPLVLEFFNAQDLPDIVSSFNTLCREIQVDPSSRENIYPSLRSKLQQWKCVAVWELLNARAAQPEYCGQTPCKGKRILIVGAGPVGLRAAIEAALLGAEVDVVEKRKSFSRNNVLQLWPFVIEDLRGLGAKTFYPKFCVGGIAHICIRILQSLLLKICLILGVQIHYPVNFVDYIEPESSTDNWRVSMEPSTSSIASKCYDAIISADGKQGSLKGFPCKPFRAKLAIAVTANFVRHHTDEEARVKEVGGLAFIYSQSFFKSLANTHGINLENIVYFKNEHHYFVMTAKKTSLLAKGVFKKDCEEPAQLLASSNINRDALEQYAKEAAEYTTEGELKNLEFVLNHRGENDVAVFDFTALYSSENASRIVERKGKKLLLCVAGDTLLESFWPTGTGLAKGFMGAFDDVWMFKRFCEGVPPHDLIGEREKVFKVMQAVISGPHGIKNPAGYTIDPNTRYFNLHLLETPTNTSHLFDSDLQHPKPVNDKLTTEPDTAEAE